MLLGRAVHAAHPAHVPGHVVHPLLVVSQLFQGLELFQTEVTGEHFLVTVEHSLVFQQLPSGVKTLRTTDADEGVFDDTSTRHGFLLVRYQLWLGLEGLAAGLASKWPVIRVD